MTASTPAPRYRAWVTLLGTAHLAWGVVIFVTLIYAAQQWPDSASPWLARLGRGAYVLGLVHLGLMGWLHVERGWKLRRPAGTWERAWAWRAAGQVAVAAAAAGVLIQGASSRTLAAGLDRLATAALIAACGSLVLVVTTGLALRDQRPGPAASRWLLVPTAAFVAMLLVLELTRT